MNPEKIYPRTNDHETVYLKSVVKNPSIIVGNFTMYNDFVNDPRQFEKNNVLYHYPINHDRLVIGKFCSIAFGAKVFVHQRQSHTNIPVHLSVPHLFLRRGFGRPEHNERMGQQRRYYHRQRCVDWI